MREEAEVGEDGGELGRVVDGWADGCHCWRGEDGVRGMDEVDGMGWFVYELMGQDWDGCFRYPLIRALSWRVEEGI